jgi:hypothetical protein
MNIKVRVLNIFSAIALGVNKVKYIQKNSPPKVQLKNGTVFDMDIRK